jgi:hypothetical protein
VATVASRRKVTEKRFLPPSAQWISLARDRWVNYPAGDTGLRRLQELLATPARVRMPCLLIYGVSGAGKSMLLEKFQRDHTEVCQRRSGRRLVVAVQMPPVPPPSQSLQRNTACTELRRLTHHAPART